MKAVALGRFKKLEDLLDYGFKCIDGKYMKTVHNYTVITVTEDGVSAYFNDDEYYMDYEVDKLHEIDLISQLLDEGILEI